MPRSDIPKPTYAQNMRIIGHTDQNGRGDGQQIIVHRGYAYLGHVCSRGFSVVDVRDPKKPKTVNYIENPPNTWSIHLQVHDNLLLLIHAHDMFAQVEMADERNYYKPKAGTHGQHTQGKKRNWSAGMAVYDISKPTEPRKIGFMPVRGNRAASHLVHRRALGLRLGDARRFQRLHPRHHRHAGSDQAADRRKILAAGNERCRAARKPIGR